MSAALPLPVRHPDPALRPSNRPGRPRRFGQLEGETPSQVGRRQGGSPLLRKHDQSFDTRGLFEAREAARRYHQIPRLHQDFWRKYGIRVVQPAIRSSAISTYNECKRKFLYRERLGLVPRGVYSSALFIGTVFHDLLRQYYLGTAVENLPMLAARHINTTLAKLQEDLDPSGLLPNGKAYHEAAAVVDKEGKLGCALACELATRIPIQQTRDAYEILSVETVYRIKIRGIKVPLIVQPDLLLRHRKTGALWIPDHKTTSESPTQRADRLPFSFQPRFYKYVVWAYHEAIRSDDAPPTIIGGCLHNIIRKPTIRQKQKETLDEFIRRIHGWFEEKATTDPHDPPIVTSAVGHAGPILDETLLVQLHQLNLASTAYINLARYTPNDRACNPLGGAPCPYVSLCRAEAMNRVRDWPAIIRERFRQEFRGENLTYENPKQGENLKQDKNPKERKNPKEHKNPKQAKNPKRKEKPNE